MSCRRSNIKRAIDLIAEHGATPSSQLSMLSKPFEIQNGFEMRGTNTGEPSVPHECGSVLWSVVWDESMRRTNGVVAHLTCCAHPAPHGRASSHSGSRHHQ